MDNLRFTIPGSSGNLGPGFDCLGLALGVYNHFSCKPATDYSVNLSGAVKIDAKFAEPHNNLVIKSYEYACQSINQAPQPFALDIETNILTAAGMGSSGTAILAGCAIALSQEISGMNDELFAEMRGKLLQLASVLEGHPDNVAPSMYGGFVISCQEDNSNNYVAQRFAVADNIKCLILKPHAETLTAESRQSLPADVSRQDAVFNLGHCAMVVAAFATKNYELLRTAMADKLHEEYRDSSYSYAALKGKLLDSGALGVALSGSGPSVLVLTEEKLHQQLKEVAASHFQQVGIGHEDFLMPVANDGMSVTQAG